MFKSTTDLKKRRCHNSNTVCTNGVTTTMDTDTHKNITDLFISKFFATESCLEESISSRTSCGSSSRVDLRPDKSVSPTGPLLFSSLHLPKVPDTAFSAFV